MTNYDIPKIAPMAKLDNYLQSKANNYQITTGKGKNFKISI